MTKKTSDYPYQEMGKTAEQDKRTEVGGYVTSTGALRMLKELLPKADVTQASINYMIRKGKVASFELVASTSENVNGVVLVAIESLKEYATCEGTRLDNDNKQREDARIDKMVHQQLAEEMKKREQEIRKQILAVHAKVVTPGTKEQ